jgi:uncharacterized protein (DUF934 family)
MLGFAHAQTDGLVLRAGGDLLKQQAQFFERVGMKLVEKWIHSL